MNGQYLSSSGNYVTSIDCDYHDKKSFFEGFGKMRFEVNAKRWDHNDVSIIMSPKLERDFYGYELDKNEELFTNDVTFSDELENVDVVVLNKKVYEQQNEIGTIEGNNIVPDRKQYDGALMIDMKRFKKREEDYQINSKSDKKEDNDASKWLLPLVMTSMFY